MVNRTPGNCGRRLEGENLYSKVRCGKYSRQTTRNRRLPVQCAEWNRHTAGGQIFCVLQCQEFRRQGMKPAQRKPKAGAFDVAGFLKKIDDGTSTIKYPDKRIVFTQGGECDGVYYLLEGRVKLHVVSKQGKQAILTVVNPGEFFGEGCLNHQLVRMTTATAAGPVIAIRVERETMRRLLHRDQQFAESFTNHLLGRTRRVEEALVDHLFNSSERRLARMLLVIGPRRQRCQDRIDLSDDQSGYLGLDDRHHAPPHQLLHE